MLKKISILILFSNLLFISCQKTYSEIGLIKKGTIYESIYGIGTVKAEKSLKIISGVTSTVANLYVKEGDFVKKGTKLVSLDESTTFYAPFDGTITLLDIKLGQTVFPQSVLLIITNLNDRYLTVSLDQKGMIKIKPGLKSIINFDSIREENFYGKVQSIYSNDNDFLVRIKIDKMPPQILPGMTADVAINVSEKNNVFIVPANAIRNKTIYIQHENESPKIVPISIGLVDGDKVEIISNDIHEGDKILTMKD